MNKIIKNATVFVLLVAIILSFYSFNSRPDNVVTLNYSDLMSHVENGDISAASVTFDVSNMRYVVNGVMTTTEGQQSFRAISFPDASIGEVLREAGIDVSYTSKTSGAWSAVLTTLLPLLLIGFMLFFFMQQGQGGGNKVMQFGKSRARMNVDDPKKRVTFADVAGVDEVKEELQEVVGFLADPKKYSAMGARIPKGVLLYGPPGCGKTMLAKAVAGEAGVPFFSISGSDFVEMFVGVGASRVRDLFADAKKHSPCLIFIDEIDAVGRQRGTGLGGGHDEREQTLNQLLVEMDGFAGNEGIIVIAATNRPDILDPALLRAGRFDREITVSAPDVLGRRQILDVHAKNKPLSDDVDLDIVARRTPGFTGADLANVLNEAALLSVRHGRATIGMEEMEQSVERIIAGPEKKSKVISEREKRLVAYHEAGHAVVSYFLPNSDPMHKVSIIPRGRAGGYTLLLPDEDRNYATKSQMEDQLVLLLGGRMAEKLVLKDVSTGAQNDLERATGIVREMITRYGMSDELGPLTFGRQEEQVFLGRDFNHERNYSEAIAYAIDKEARVFMDNAYKRTETILSEHIAQLHQVAALLMEKETIDAAEFYNIMKDFVSPSPAMNEARERLMKESAEKAAADEAAKKEPVETKIVADDGVRLFATLSNPVQQAHWVESASAAEKVEVKTEAKTEVKTEVKTEAVPPTEVKTTDAADASTAGEKDRMKSLDSSAEQSADKWNNKVNSEIAEVKLMTSASKKDAVERIPSSDNGIAPAGKKQHIAKKNPVITNKNDKTKKKQPDIDFWSYTDDDRAPKK